MADTDNLDNLSNAELREQMKAHGLPNIPVTDSSRKVLVKRLRASISGNAAPSAAAGNPKKPTSRRETLQPALAAGAMQMEKSDSAQAIAKPRRTIAAPSSDIREDERRRQPEVKKAVPEPSAVNYAPMPAANANIKKPSTRRDLSQPATSGQADKPDSAQATFKSERTVAVQPRERPVEVQPRERTAAVQPRERPVEVQPRERTAAVQPRERPVEVQPRERPAAVQPRERPAAVQPRERPLAAQPREIPVAAQPRERPAADQPREIPLAAQPREIPVAAQPRERPVAAVTNIMAAPIQSRRVSNSESTRREQVPERIVREPEPIAEEPQADKTLPVNSLIVLDSDDEEDQEMARAAQTAEDLYTRRKVVNYTVNAHEYVPNSLYPSLEEHRPRQPVYEPAQRPIQPRTAVVDSAPISPTNTAGSVYDSLAATGRYSSVIASPINSYTRSSTRAAYSGTFDSGRLRRTPPRTFSNEFSDDNADEDRSERSERKERARFESDFARNLARLRTERIGEPSSPYRRTMGGGSTLGSITGARRSMRQEQPVSLRTHLVHLWRNLDEKYKLAPKLFLLLVVLVLFGVYCLFF